MPNILRLLRDLADPDKSDLLRRFLSNPREVMTEYELTDGEQAIVLSGDLRLIHAAIQSAAIEVGYELEGDRALVIVVTWAPRPKPMAMEIGTF